MPNGIHHTKKVKTEYGSYFKKTIDENPYLIGEPNSNGSIFGKVSIPVFQHILSLLTVKELVQFDTAFCSNQLRTKLFAAYEQGIGLRSRAADHWHYDSIASIRWMMDRMICLHNFLLELQDPVQYAKGKNNVLRLHVKHDTSRNVSLPTFHWLAYYDPNKNHYADIVYLMAANGARSSLERTDNNGWTALHLACDLGHDQLVRLLVGRGDLNLDSLSGIAQKTDMLRINPSIKLKPSTALEHAIIWGSAACVAALLAGGVIATSQTMDLAIKRAGNGKKVDLLTPISKDVEEENLRTIQFSLCAKNFEVLEKMQELHRFQQKFNREAYSEDKAAIRYARAATNNVSNIDTESISLQIIRVMLQMSDKSTRVKLLCDRNKNELKPSEEATLQKKYELAEFLKVSELQEMLEETQTVMSQASNPVPTDGFDDALAASALLSLMNL